MEYLCYDLYNVSAGDIVEVTLSAAANVCLLDSSNYYRYQHGMDFSYRGGYAEVSPVRITIPYAGRWYLTIDLGGYSGSVSCGVHVIKR